MRLSLRTKLTVSFSAVVAVIALFFSIVALRLIGDWVIRKAHCEMAADLNSAREEYIGELNCIRMVVTLTAERFFIKNAVLKGDLDGLKREFIRIRKVKCPDILTLTDDRGRVIYRSRNPGITGDSQAGDEIVREVLTKKKPVAFTTIISSKELEKEGKDLAERAHVKFVHTPGAKPSNRIEETSGMMMKAAAPIFDDKNNLIAVLYGGNLLNRNYDIVDKVKRTLCPGTEYKGMGIVTSTIFQNDLRISTNVRDEDGNRAIGTRVSGEVYDNVLINGKSWISRAFVVNDRYFAAYEPIKNIQGNNIGMLCVGILEKAFTDVRKRTALLYIAITFTGVILAMVIAHGITRPIRFLAKSAEEITKGDLSRRIQVKSNDEIGKLEKAFSLMTKKLRTARDDYEKTLEQKVSELQEAHAYVMRTEKLASLGLMAAGVAHELNNPLASVLNYCHYLKRKIGDDEAIQQRLDVMIKEITRCSEIVKNLLGFAGKGPTEEKMVDVNIIMNQTLALLENQAIFHDIEVKREFDKSLPNIMADEGQMKQAFMNIILNATEAFAGMDKGILSIATRTINDHIEIEFRDNGCGIPAEDIEKVFDPFYTKKEQGTGLGLTLVYGIVNRYQGGIEVKSDVGKGSTITIRLPGIGRTRATNDPLKKA
jgi:two-component system NtrC family sensor kinase